jgi:hypothetical protein
MDVIENKEDDEHEIIAACRAKNGESMPRGGAVAEPFVVMEGG